MKRISFAFTSLLISSSLWAAPVTVTTFSSGTSISSSAMNINFSNIVTAFNATNTGLYIFPVSDGTNGQVLSTNGSGTLSWISAAAGVTSLNLMTGPVQTFAIGTAGNIPSWSSASNIHTLNIPLASSAGTVTAGLLSNSDWTNFNNKMNPLIPGSPGQSLIWNGAVWTGGSAFSSSGFMVKLSTSYSVSCVTGPTILGGDFHKVSVDSSVVADFGTYNPSLAAGVYEILLDMPYTLTGAASVDFILSDGTTEIKINPGRSVKRLTAGTWHFYIGCDAATPPETLTITGSKFVYGVKLLN